MVKHTTMGVGRGGRGSWPPWILKYSAEMVVFLVSSGKNQVSPLLATPWKKTFRRPCI